MKISVSNIGWDKQHDDEMYKYITKSKLNGIEIAPTRIIEDRPYEKNEQAVEFAKNIQKEYNLEISSMQSIWYGKQGNIFDEENAKMFIEYTKKAIDFASDIKCRNLVFGCPKNRNIPDGKTTNDIIYFFKELGDYAEKKKTIIAIEPNPTIYGTNFLNTTKEAIEFARKIESKGIKINVDFGTIVENKETLETIQNNIDLVNHIHISEPNLEVVKERPEHKKLADILKKSDYKNYISIEMKNTGDLNDIKTTIEYVATIFG